MVETSYMSNYHPTTQESIVPLVNNLTCELGHAEAAGMYFSWLKSRIWEVLATPSSLVFTGSGVLLAVQVWHLDDGSAAAMLASKQ